MATTRDTDQDWRRVAEDDPYWGVLSQNDYRKDSLDSLRLEEFMASGETYVGNLFSLIDKHLVSNFQPQRALDFGCGVGRLLIPLAKRVPEVAGVDVAPAMLKLCRRHAKQAGLRNIKLFTSDDSLGKLQGTFDLINSYIVLQHIAPERGYKLIHAMLERLAIGGVGSIQLTYAKSRKFFMHEQPRALYYRRENGMLIDILESNWSPPEGTINMYDYDLNQVMALLSKFCGHPIIALPTNDDSHLGMHFIFVKAR